MDGGNLVNGKESERKLKQVKALQGDIKETKDAIRNPKDVQDKVYGIIHDLQDEFVKRIAYCKN